MKMNLRDFLQSGAILYWGPDSWLLSAGKPEQIQAPNSKRPCFYWADFFAEKGCWWDYPESWEATTEQVKSFLGSDPEILNFSNKNRNWKSSDPEEFATYFHRFRQLHARGEVQKVVPVISSTSDGNLEDGEILRILSHLCIDREGLYPYGIWSESEGLIGCTPEILFSRWGHRGETMALAGTYPAGKDGLLEDPKELDEHQWVKKDIQERFPGSLLEWTKAHVFSAGPLQHLRSRANFKSAFAFEEIVSAMHPTAALGGYPRKNSLHWLEDFCRSSERKMFGGPFGVKFGNREHCIVAIRNISWNTEKAFLSSGCGLVSDSQLEKEQNELKIKQNFTREYLGL